MGAGFGHTYAVYNNSYAALAFSHGNGDIFELAEECVQAQNTEIEDQDDYFTVEHEVEHSANCLIEDLKAIETIEVTFKGRTFDVEVGIESTYNGDDLCLVPTNLWGAYSETIENTTQGVNVIDWSGVAKFEDSLQVAFELALCAAVFKECPWMYVRKRTLGWCGTAYKPVSAHILDLKKQ